VKEQYQELAATENKQQITRSTMGETPDAYYENLLSLVIDEINAGTFDAFYSGHEIVNAVANNKDKWLSNWKDHSS
jgi:hypothetical protein